MFLSLSKVLDGDTLRGQRIQVNHPNYGVLFSVMITAHGVLVTEEDEQGNPLPFLSTEEILKQLMKFGFYIEYDVKSNLPSSMINLLQELLEFGYEKLTVVLVKERESGSNLYVFRSKVVAFKLDGNLDILTFGTKLSDRVFKDKLAANTMMNLTPYEDMDWGWLNYTCNIADILDENIDPVDEFKTDGNVQEGQGYAEEGYTPYVDPEDQHPYENLYDDDDDEEDDDAEFS